MKLRSSLGLRGKGGGRLAVGLLGILLSAGYALEAYNTLPLGSIREPGAALFPLMVAALMAGAGLAIVVEQTKLRTAERAPLDLPRGADLRRLLSIAVTIFGYVWMVSYLGFLPASVAMSLILVRLLKSRSWLETIVTGLAIAFSTYVLFVMILNVPLPKGELW